jgi:hypothetical protein
MANRINKPERVTQIWDGIWYRVANGKPPYHHICCDCSLTHLVEFKVENGIVWERWTVDKAETKRQRKAAKGTK